MVMLLQVSMALPDASRTTIIPIFKLRLALGPNVQFRMAEILIRTFIVLRHHMYGFIFKAVKALQHVSVPRSVNSVRLYRGNINDKFVANASATFSEFLLLHILSILLESVKIVIL